MFVGNGSAEDAVQTSLESVQCPVPEPILVETVSLSPTSQTVCLLSRVLWCTIDGLQKVTDRKEECVTEVPCLPLPRTEEVPYLR